MPQKSESNQPKEAKSKSLPSGRTPELRLWTTHGVEDVYLQREAVVNFWTVLGGLAMAALLTQLSPLLHELQESH